MKALLWMTAIGGLAWIPAQEPAKQIPPSYRDLVFPARPPFEPSQPVVVEMPNGIRLFLMENRELPLISGFARLRVGSIDEPADKLALASITGTVMRSGGTERFPGDRLDEDLARIAASVETSIGDDSGEASFRCLREDFDLVFEIFGEVIRKPAFPEAKIDLAKKQIATSIRRRNDSPGPIANREFEKLLWGSNSPWARTVELEHLERIRRSDLLSFHQRFFVSNNLWIGIVGDFDSVQVKAAVEKAFGDWERRPVERSVVSQDPLRPEKRSVFLVDKKDINQSTILLGHEGVRRDDADYPALQLFSFILGSGGFSSRLVQIVRSDKGYAYSVRAGFEGPFSRRGLFRSSCGTKSASTAAAIDAILKECQRILDEKPSEEELRSAKDRILNRDIFQVDTSEKVLRRQVELAFRGYPADFFEREEETIRALTLEEVWQAGKRRLSPERLTVLVVGNAAAFDSPLDRFGPVTLLDISSPRPSDPPSAAASPEALSRGRELLAFWTEAMGGGLQLQGLRSFLVKGEELRNGPNEKTFKVPFEMLALLPDRVRLRSEVLGTEVIQVMDASGGWTKLPQGVQDIPEAQAKEARANLLDRHFLALLARAAKGEFQAEYLGVEKTEAGFVESVRLRREGMPAIDLSFQSSNHQLIRADFREGNDEISLRFEDYRPVGPFLVPFHSAKYVNGKLDRSKTATEYQINVEVSNASFARPTD